MNKKPMQQRSDEWEATRTCPCGESYSWSDWTPELREWTEKHREHTNGMLSHAVGDDWYKVYGTRPKDTLRPL